MLARVVSWLMLAMMWMAGLTYCVFVVYGMWALVRDMLRLRDRARGSRLRDRGGRLRI